MSEKKSFFLALKFFVSDIGSAFSDLFRSLPFVGSRREQLDKVISKLNRLGERLERIEERLGGKLEKNLSVHPKNIDSSDQYFSTLSTYPDNPRSDKEILDDMEPKSEVAQAIKEKMDEIKVKDAEWLSVTSALYVPDTDSDNSDPDRLNLDEPWEEIRKKEWRRTKKQAATLKGEELLQKIEKVEAAIRSKESVIVRKEQDLDKHQNNLKAHAENLKNLEEAENECLRNTGGSEIEDWSAHKNIQRQILDLENEIYFVEMEITSVEIDIKIARENLGNLRAELSLLEVRKKEEEQETDRDTP